MPVVESTRQQPHGHTDVEFSDLSKPILASLLIYEHISPDITGIFPKEFTFKIFSQCCLDIDNQLIGDITRYSGEDMRITCEDIALVDSVVIEKQRIAFG